jgi:hypothetical protein
MMLLGACLGPLAEVALAQTKKAAVTCADHTADVMLGSDKYMACRSKAIAERRLIHSGAKVGQYTGGGFVETALCVEDLKKNAEVAVNATRTCLINDQRPTISEALFAYHVTWEVLLFTLTDPDETSQIFEMRIMQIEKLALNRLLKYVSLMH